MRRSRLTVIAVTVLSTAVGLGVAVALSRLTGPFVHAVLVLPVIVSAWYGRLFGGLLAVVLLTLSAAAVIPPAFSFMQAGSHDLIRTVVFASVAVLVSVMVNRQRRTAEAFATTLASIGDGVFVTDRRGCLLAVNPAGTGLTGWSEAAARGRRIDEVVQLGTEHPEVAMENPGYRAIHEGAIIRIAANALLVSRDGARTPVDATAAPVRGEDGTVLGAVVVVKDETAKRQAERALQESQRRFERIAGTAPDFVFVYDLVEGRNVYANERLSDLLGYSVAELRSMPGDLAAGLVHPEDLQSVRSALAHLATAPDGEIVDYDHRLRCKTGGYRLLRVRATPFERGADGRARSVVGHAYDVTAERQHELERERLLAEREEALRQAEDAARAKDRFLATLSHELRTPLNALLGWSELLAGGKVPHERIPEAAEAIHRNAQLQQQLTEDLLDISRITAGRMRLQPEDLELSTVVLDALQVVRPAAEAKGIRVRVQQAGGAARVHADRLRLQQALWNLLTNAVRFTPNGGEVVITLRQDDRSAEVEVADTGTGIDPAFLPHLFQPFTQAMTGRARTGGLGLGLAIARHVAEAHGGSIRAHSRGKGTGATFTIAVPRPGAAHCAAGD